MFSAISSVLVDVDVGKSAVAAMNFTVEDKRFIDHLLWATENCVAKWLPKTFLTRDGVLVGLKY